MCIILFIVHRLFSRIYQAEYVMSTTLRTQVRHRNNSRSEKLNKKKLATYSFSVGILLVRHSFDSFQFVRFSLSILSSLAISTQLSQCNYNELKFQFNAITRPTDIIAVTIENYSK